MKIRNIIVIASLLIGLSVSVVASTGGAFLDNGLGNRAIGMGMSQVAIANDGYSAYWNPAGLVHLPETEVNTMMSSVFGVVDQKFIGYATKLPDGRAFSAFYTTSGVSGIVGSSYNSITGLVSATGQDFTYEASAIYLSTAGSYTKLINWLFGSDVLLADYRELFIGASLKFISERLQERSASGMGVDFGLMTRLDTRMSLGIQLQNIVSPYMAWNTAEQPAEHLPLIIKTGIGYQLNEKTLFGLDLDIRPSEENKYLLHYGVEHNLWQTPKAGLIVRAGLDRGKFAFGLGLNYQDFKGDYAYEKAPADYMADTHRFSIGYRFPAIQAQPKKTENVLAVVEHKINIPVVSAEKPKQKEIIVVKEEVIDVTAKPVLVVPTVSVSEVSPLDSPVTKVLTTNVFGKYKVEKAQEIVSPELIIELPTDPIVVSNPQIGIRGKAINTKTMLINGLEVWCNDHGFFYQVVPLVLWENIINFKAVSRTGHETVVERKIFRNK